MTSHPSASKLAQASGWRPPVSKHGHNAGLKVYNSLTKSKVEFVPREGKKVTWYNCGPTVYDASHMGHARNYVAQDILRRIVRDYFGYDVHLVMNVTDIDDKIIQRARHQHLISDLVASSTSITPSLLSLVQEAFDAYYAKNMGQLVGGMSYEQVVVKLVKEQGWRKEMVNQEERFGMWVDALDATKLALSAARKASESGPTDASAAATLITSSSDILSPHLDTLHGSTLTSPTLSQALAQKWEKHFFEDMNKLNVQAPETLTRVTEYVPEIVAFVEKIIKNGYAYEGQGSVWFDVMTFDGASGTTEKAENTSSFNHTYAKLNPAARAALASNAMTPSTESGFAKKHPADFALWKASKPGEPSWPSPWGPGRPGWHIECSVMASCVLGEGMDVHSGGVDLMFPHHDNEIAQSEAYHGCEQWVNYFLHTGHLHIEGLKMSKSLKNFITIEDALQRHSARQLRLSFLAQRWDLGMDFAESAMAEVRAQEATFNNFFAIIKALDYELRAEGKDNVEGKVDAELAKELLTAQANFRTALSDSFNTPEAVRALLFIITESNKLLKKSRTEVFAGFETLRSISGWVEDMLRMFGLVEWEKSDVGEIGWIESKQEALVVSHLLVWSGFRDSVRSLARSNASPEELLALCKQLEERVKAELGVTVSDTGVRFEEPKNTLRKSEATLTRKEGEDAQREATLSLHLTVWAKFYSEVLRLASQKAPSKELLSLCDRLRDQELVELGVALDDQDDGKALIKFLPAEGLIRIREDKAAAIREKAERQAASQAAAQAKREEKLMKGKASPAELFKSPNSEEFGKWDEEGVPTHDKEGVEVSKAKRKKCVKEWEAQKKMHEEYLKWQASL